MWTAKALPKHSGKMIADDSRGQDSTGTYDTNIRNFIFAAKEISQGQILQASSELSKRRRLVEKVASEPWGAKMTFCKPSRSEPD